MRKALQLAAKQQFGAHAVDETGENSNLRSEDHPKPMLMFLTDGIATAGELLSSKILAQIRALNTEIRVTQQESNHFSSFLSVSLGGINLHYSSLGWFSQYCN